MDHPLVVSSLLLLLWRSGLQTEEKHHKTESVRLVYSRCNGKLEVNKGDWKPVDSSYFTLKDAAVVCRELDCGSAVSVTRLRGPPKDLWEIESECLQSGSALTECVTFGSSSHILGIICSDAVRLVNGTSLCSGRLEVKSNQSDQSWSSVCEADFDQHDAEVVCRELGCGAPLVFQGALYGEVETSMWTEEFQCAGYEYALLDCRSSGSTRNTCSPGKAVGLTCSEPVRLVGGQSRCAGTLEVKRGQWRLMSDLSHGPQWTLKDAAVACRELGCGSPISLGLRKVSAYTCYNFWMIKSDCVQSGSALRECVGTSTSCNVLDLTCSDSVRLVNGTSLCSGRLEVKSNQSDQSNQSNQSDQSWSSVCEADFDQQDAEVVCRELGCGAPLVFQGALYGEVETSLWTEEFQCAGNESALLDCRSSGSTRNTCSPGKAVGLTCSEPVRLVGGQSRCAGTLEVKRGEWRPVRFFYTDWTLKEMTIACKELDCGSAVFLQMTKQTSDRPVWAVRSDWVQSGSALRECVTLSSFSTILELTCSDVLVQPNITVSTSLHGVSVAQQVFSGSNFTISCSTLPQYPGGTFLLTSSAAAGGYARPAVGHSAHFPFPAAEPVHQGNYSCVYRVYAHSQSLFSESRWLSLTVSDLLVQPSISVSTSMHGVSVAQQVFGGSPFTITCSTQPQYPGGTFLLAVTSSDAARSHSYTQPAVNHSARFPFPAAESGHEGNYSCVYRVYAFSRNFSSASHRLSLTVSDHRPTAPIIRAVVLLLLALPLTNAALYFCRKASRRQRPRVPESAELDELSLAVPAPGGEPTEQDGAE